jgi:outer membrane receptor protein involved in Fe transport
VVRIDPADTVQVRLDEAIQQAPGASLFRRTSSLAANPTTQGLSLRSIAPSGAGRALVTLDGVPQNDPFGGWVIWSQLPPESIEGLSVVRGAGSGAYGAGALTGVVALEERSRGVTADAFVAELGSARAAAAAEGPAGRLRLFAAAASETSDGYVPVRGPHRGAADTRVDLGAWSATGRATAEAGPAVLSVRLNHYDERRGAGLAGARSRATGTSASATLTQSPTADALGWRLQAWARESDFANTSVAVAPGRGSTTPANDQYETPATGLGVNAAVRRRTGRSEWELGVDARATEGEVRELFFRQNGVFTRTREAGGRTTVAGAYGEATWTDGPWLLTGGLRADRWTSTDAVRLERNRTTGATTLEQRAEDRSGVVPTGRAGARLAVRPNLHARAAAYAGFRPATLNELHRPFRVGNDVTEANAGLEPERLYGVEIGLGGGAGESRWSIGLFHNTVVDPITNVTLQTTLGGVLRQRRNAGRIKALGIEAEGTHDLTDRLSLRAAVSGTDARVDGGSAAPQLTGKRPAQAPVWTATAGAAWRATAGLTARTDLRWESARFEDDLNSRRLGAALLADAALELTLRPGVAAYLAAENLLDAEVEVGETADGVEQWGAPRVIRAGLRLTR